MPERVLIADDHAPTRAMVRRALTDGGFVVCAEAADAEGAIEAARSSEPDLALLDVRMPGSGIRAAGAIVAEHPEVLVVMLTVSADDSDLFAALSAGASGYILKGQPPGKIPQTLRQVLAGEAVLPRTFVKRIASEFRVNALRRRIRAVLPGGDRLTTRECEVLELMYDGLSTAEIGRHLDISDVTVRTHIVAITRKLQVKDRAGAVQRIRGTSG